MLSLPRAVLFNPAVAAIIFSLCLAVSGSFSGAQAQNATIPASNATGDEQNNIYSHEEIIDFKSDPDLVGHLKEEATSYAAYEDKMSNDTLPDSNSFNATSFNATAFNATSFNATSPNAKTQPPVKVVPPKGPQPSAMRLFRFIPPSIFDNTIEGMREDEKQLLMDTGETDFWVLTALSEEELVIQNKALEADTQVTLRLFRASNGDTVVAMGVNAGDSCALELWRYMDKRRALTPMPMPDEPAVSDFFETHRVLPEDTDVSMLICLDPVEETLIAKPLIWTPSGLDPIKLDTKVYYIWNGDSFVKTIAPLH